MRRKSKDKIVRAIEKDLHTPKYRSRVVPDTKQNQLEKQRVKEWIDLLYTPIDKL